MSVKSISMLSETNAFDSVRDNDYGEGPQGSSYDLTRIYEITNDDGTKQYFKFVVVLNSYGNAGGNYDSVESAIPKTFTEVKLEKKNVTVFK